MIRVIDVGIQSSIQDKGRYGYQELGISSSGVMDDWSYRLANVLVANEEEAACIEVTYGGLCLGFELDMEISITGAIVAAKLNGHPVPMNETVYVQCGDKLELGYALRGVYSYVGFSKALDIRAVLGSCSTDITSGIGGLEGRVLRQGDSIPVKDYAYTLLEKRCVPEALQIKLQDEAEIQVLEGLEFERFTEKSQIIFMSSIFEVSQTCSRMGYRLKGDFIQSIDGNDILSTGLTRGTIQGTASGELIIMMSDHQSTGGYTRIGHVITCDQPALAQLRTGSKVNFKVVSLEEAHCLLREKEKEFKRWLETLSPRKQCHAIAKRFKLCINNKYFTVKVDLLSNKEGGQ